MVPRRARPGGLARMGGAHERKGDLAFRARSARGRRAHAVHGLSRRGAGVRPRGGTCEGERPTLEAGAGDARSEAMIRSKVGFWMVIGIAIGCAVGVAMKNIPVGTGLGAAIGIAIGFATSRASKR